jgi:hypothetical protein
MKNFAILVAQVCVEIAKNAAMGLPAVRRARLARHRTAPIIDRSQLDRYAFALLDRITKHLGPIRGKSVLEIGPGDHLASGLAFLAAGAKSYAALDRFPGAYSGDVARRWYRLVADAWPEKYPGLEWPGNLDPERFPEYAEVRTFQVSVEDFSERGGYDVVCSFAVGEHVSDVRAFAAVNRRAIAESGAGFHVIDFGGHQWDRADDPYLFLRFPSLIWRAMASNRGLPNRARFHEYVTAFGECGLAVEVADQQMFRSGASQPPASLGRLPKESAAIQEATFIVRPNAFPNTRGGVSS